jgi:hypothetical protein
MKQIQLLRKESRKCECCDKYSYNAYFFKWHSIVTDDYLCTICFKCARRELFGTRYNYNKRYKKWVSELQEK